MGWSTRVIINNCPSGPAASPRRGDSARAPDDLAEMNLLRAQRRIEAGHRANAMAWGSASSSTEPTNLRPHGMVRTHHSGEAVLERVRRRRGTRRHAELRVEVLEVPPHGVLADHELHRDVAVRLARREQAQDLGLPRGEPGRQLVRPQQSARPRRRRAPRPAARTPTSAARSSSVAPSSSPAAASAARTPPAPARRLVRQAQLLPRRCTPAEPFERAVHVAFGQRERAAGLSADATNAGTSGVASAIASKPSVASRARVHVPRGERDLHLRRQEACALRDARGAVPRSQPERPERGIGLPLASRSSASPGCGSSPSSRARAYAVLGAGQIAHTSPQLADL